MDPKDTNKQSPGGSATNPQQGNTPGISPKGASKPNAGSMRGSSQPTSGANINKPQAGGQPSTGGSSTPSPTPGTSQGKGFSGSNVTPPSPDTTNVPKPKTGGGQTPTAGVAQGAQKSTQSSKQAGQKPVGSSATAAVAGNKPAGDDSPPTKLNTTAAALQGQGQGSGRQGAQGVQQKQTNTPKVQPKSQPKKPGVGQSGQGNSGN